MGGFVDSRVAASAAAPLVLTAAASSQRRWLWALGAAVGVSGLVGWWALGSFAGARPAAAQAQGTPGDAPTPAERPVPVVVAPAVLASGEHTVQAIATAEAQRSANLMLSVEGEVAAVHFRAGDRVRAGQVLLTLVDRRQQLDLEMASARVDQARSLLARYDATAGTGAVPGSVIDDARSALRTAEVARRLAAEALAERTLRAPFDGVVGLPQVDAGDRLTPQTLITVLDDRRRLWLAFDLPEAELASLKPGHPVRAETPALPGQAVEGRVREWDNRLDPVTRTLRVRAELPNPDDRLRPGMSFSVRLTMPGGSHLQVPDLALQYGREGSHVWVVREGRAERVAVTLVQRRAGVVLLDGALRPNEPVVLEGVQRLRPSRPVQVVTPPPA